MSDVNKKAILRAMVELGRMGSFITMLEEEAEEASEGGEMPQVISLPFEVIRNFGKVAALVSKVIIDTGLVELQEVMDAVDVAVAEEQQMAADPNSDACTCPNCVARRARGEPKVDIVDVLSEVLNSGGGKVILAALGRGRSKPPGTLH